MHNTSPEVNMNRNTLWWYLGITFAASYAWQLAIFLTGGIESTLFPFVMWFPGAVAIVFCIVFKQSIRTIGWGLRRWWYVFPAVFVPLAVSVAAMLLLSALGWATWNNEIFTFSGGTVTVARVRLMLGNHTQGIAFFALNFALSLIVQSSMGGLFTLGEEVGWRGYLQEKMLGRFGLNRGLLLLGAIWGYWHLPIIMMGYNFPEHPVLGAVLFMPVGTTLIGIFMGWIYLRSRSIWVPALAHGSANLTAMLLFNGMSTSQPGLLRQFVWMAVWGVAAALCLISLNRKKPTLRQA
jgi:membrane protease YdiL (CAAX protease family)